MHSKKKNETQTAERINLTLTPELSKVLNNYCLAVANKQGSMPSPKMKPKIVRMALTEWLENHGKDLTIKF